MTAQRTLSATQPHSKRRSLRSEWGLILLAIALFSTPPSLGAEEHALALEGVDEIQALPPGAAQVVPYENLGYRMWLEDGVVRVRVDNSYLGSQALFVAEAHGDPQLVRLASHLTKHSDTVYDATSEILAWIARSIRYDLDRSHTQEPLAVLERRSGYCTGIAKLTVQLLSSVGIESREVAGYVFKDRPGGVEGYHRWIEVHYPDRGWAFSDPTSSHHFVPATYVRINSGTLDLTQSKDGLLLSRSRRLSARDVVPGVPAIVRARKNDDRQHAGSLQVTVEGVLEGTAVLRHKDSRLTSRLQAGSASFTGLHPGVYRLEVKLPSGEVLRRRLKLHKKIRADLSLRPTLPPARVGG